MKYLWIFAAVFIATLFQVASSKSIAQEWEDFKVNYGRDFTVEEERYRKGVFFENLERILEQNEKYRSGAHWASVINGWSDRTTAEFRARKGYNTGKQSNKQ